MKVIEVMSVSHWATLIRQLQRDGRHVGLLGAPPKQSKTRYHAGEIDTAVISAGALDLRGRLNLPQVAGALARVPAFVTVDNGLMHMAAAVGTPTVALFGGSPRRIWAPRVSSVQVLEPPEPCLLCEENRFRNADCLLPVHQCLPSITPERVHAQLARLLNTSDTFPGELPPPLEATWPVV